MTITDPKQAEIFDKLVTVAGGDVRRVERAIWAASDAGKHAAPLDRVLAELTDSSLPAPKGA